MAKSKLILVCGPPCSGKSTWIQNNNQENLPILSTDSLIEEQARKLNTTYDVVWENNIRSTVLEFGSQLAEISKRGDSFIVDQTNLTVKSRRKKLHLCKDYYKIAVYFEVPLEILLLRNTQRPGKVIPQITLERMVSSYCRPIKEEGFDLIIDGTKNSTVHNSD